MLDDYTIVAVAGTIKRALPKLRIVSCYGIEAAKMGVRAVAEVATRASITFSHGPISVTIAPKDKA